MLNRIKKFLAARRKLKAIEELATISGNSGGLLLRIHENRQLMQLLYKEAPQLVESHFWLVGWIRCNDDFFNELNEILDLPFRRISHEIYEYPRPWPEKDSTDDWPRLSQQSRSGAVHLNVVSHVRNFFAVDRKLEAIDELAIKRGNMRGLLKRIDENRELLELLQSEVPQLVATDFWLVRWIRYNDIFFNELKEILQIPTRKGWSFPPYYPTYPRPWPAQNASEYGPDGTPLSQAGDLSMSPSTIMETATASTGAERGSMFTGEREVVVSEPDIEVALNHLRALPNRVTSPLGWDRQRLLYQLREAIGQRPKVDQCHGVAPGVFAIVKPFGVDMVFQGSPENGRLQVWLLIRPFGTDPTRITRL